MLAAKPAKQLCDSLTEALELEVRAVRGQRMPTVGCSRLASSPTTSMFSSTASHAQYAHELDRPHRTGR